MTAPRAWIAAVVLPAEQVEYHLEAELMNEYSPSAQKMNLLSPRILIGLRCQASIGTVGQRALKV